MYPLLSNKMLVHCNVGGELYYKYQCKTEEIPKFKNKRNVMLKHEDVLHILGLVNEVSRLY